MVVPTMSRTIPPLSCEGGGVPPENILLLRDRLQVLGVHAATMRAVHDFHADTCLMASVIARSSIRGADPMFVRPDMRPDKTLTIPKLAIALGVKGASPGPAALSVGRIGKSEEPFLGCGRDVDRRAMLLLIPVMGLAQALGVDLLVTIGDGADGHLSGDEASPAPRAVEVVVALAQTLGVVGLVTNRTRRHADRWYQVCQCS